MCDIDQFPMWADMIRSDQLDHMTVHEFMEDHPAFAAWYEGQYINTVGYQNYERNNEKSLAKWAEENPDNSWVQKTAIKMIRSLWRKEWK